MTINVDLGKLEGFVAELARSGRYGSEAEVVTEALELLQLRESRRRELDAALQRGLDEIDVGRVVERKRFSTGSKRSMALWPIETDDDEGSALDRRSRRS